MADVAVLLKTYDSRKMILGMSHAAKCSATKYAGYANFYPYMTWYDVGELTLLYRRNGI